MPYYPFWALAIIALTSWSSGDDRADGFPCPHAGPAALITGPDARVRLFRPAGGAPVPSSPGAPKAPSDRPALLAAAALTLAATGGDASAAAGPDGSSRGASPCRGAGTAGDPSGPARRAHPCPPAHRPHGSRGRHRAGLPCRPRRPGVGAGQRGCHPDAGRAVPLRPDLHAAQQAGPAHTIYLDFDGTQVAGTAWNASGRLPGTSSAGTLGRRVHDVQHPGAGRHPVGLAAGGRGLRPVRRRRHDAGPGRRGARHGVRHPGAGDPGRRRLAGTLQSAVEGSPTSTSSTCPRGGHAYHQPASCSPAVRATTRRASPRH